MGRFCSPDLINLVGPLRCGCASYRGGRGLPIQFGHSAFHNDPEVEAFYATANAETAPAWVAGVPARAAPPPLVAPA